MSTRQTKHGRRPLALGAAALTATLALSYALAEPATASSPGSAQSGETTQRAPATSATLTTPGPDKKGRLLWRFRIQAPYALAEPAVAADGTIYVVDGNAHLYALSPDGQLEWRVDGAGDAGVDIGPDGTIYTGSTTAIKAFNPDGSLKWTFDQDPAAFILLGANVGPEGNIYAVASSGLGVFSLTPEGALRWNIPEPYDRLIVEFQELAFGPGSHGTQQLYFHANKHFKAISLDGKTVFTVDGDGRGNCGGEGQPKVGPNGDVYTTNWEIGEGAKLESFKPGGSRNWTFVHQPNNCQSELSVGPDGRVYIVWNISRLFSVSPDGDARELAVDFDHALNDPSPSPTGKQVVVPGSDINTRTGNVQSFRSRDGKPLWSVDLPDQKGAPQVPMSEGPVHFSPDGRTVYVTSIVSGVYDHSFIYAINARP